MGLPNVMQTGRSGMLASKAGIATTGHNISNATTEGFSRQRTEQSAEAGKGGFGQNLIGRGTTVSRTTRINDEYVEKQIRNASRDLAQMEEKDLLLRQTEDIFNEMGGEGLNRLMARFFNEFRKLANEPENEAIRQSVREASLAMVNDFKRLRNSVDEVARHIDHKLEGYAKEATDLSHQIRELNLQIKAQENNKMSPNDLMDKRDTALKRLGSLMELTVYKAEDGQFTVDIKGIGPLVVGPHAEEFTVKRSPADLEGKGENRLDFIAGGRSSPITHVLKGGKIGALLEVRDRALSTVVDRLDEMAYALSSSFNEIHRQGFTRTGIQGVGFFKDLGGKTRASELLDLSDEVKGNVNFIAAAAQPDSPGDSRVAVALSGLQNAKLLNDGQATVDDFYNSIVSDVGVLAAHNRNGMNQAKDITTQLSKIRDQVSGVSIDEETANLMQFQQMFGASAKVIQVADEMLKTVLDLKR